MAVPAWNPGAGPPAYLYVKLADHLEARIRAGELAPGARLPNERELGEMYGVSIGTGRRAVRELRARGLVTTLAVLGTYVN